MPMVNNIKVACEPCIRGHRATSCSHGRDRRLVPVRKPGRPLGEYHPRPPPLAIAREKQGCRCGGATAVGSDGKKREGRRPSMAPDSGFPLPGPCSSRSHSHGPATGSPSPAVPQPVVGHASAPPPSPATTTRSGYPFDAQSGPLENSRPATSLAPVHAAAFVSPRSFSSNENCITPMYDPGLEAPFLWTPPELAKPPSYVLPSVATPPATQPIGVNLPLCTHCAGQMPGIVQPQVLVLNHLGQAQAWPPSASHPHQAAGNAPPQAVIMYVSVQPQGASVEQEFQNLAAGRSVHDSTNESTVPQCFQPNISNGVQNSSGADLSWFGQLHTGTSQTTVGSPTSTITGEGIHGCTAWLQNLPLSPTHIPFPCADELNAGLLSPESEAKAWDNNLSSLRRRSGDALVSPLSGCRCGGQHSYGCDLGCVPEAPTGL